MRGGDPALASRAPQARAGPPAARDRRPLVAVAIVVLALLLLGSAASPPAAAASGILGTGISIPNPISLIGSGISSLLGGLGGDIAKLAVGAFEAIIRALFAPIAKFITTQLIGWVITVPNLTQGNVTRLEQTVEAMAGGLLGAVATISTIRYWAAGFAGGGDSGFAALEGLIRTVAAALFLASWPWVFESGVHLTNLFTSSLMGSTAVVDQTARLLAAGLGAGVALSFTPIGLFCNIAMAVAASLLFLGLLLLKVVVSASTILVFVGMPEPSETGVQNPTHQEAPCPPESPVEQAELPRPCVRAGRNLSFVRAPPPRGWSVDAWTRRRCGCVLSNPPSP